jgi:hypothetical protein
MKNELDNRLNQKRQLILMAGAWFTMYKRITVMSEDKYNVEKNVKNRTNKIYGLLKIAFCFILN